MRAVSHALQIVHWQENLAGDDMPPRWMWHLDDALNDHFSAVQFRRDAERDRTASDEPAPRLMRNALAG